MVLQLRDPTSSTFIKDFPAQHAANMDDIDSYAGPCLNTQALTPWVPILTADVANPVLGTGGYIKGYYYRIFDQIWAWGEFRFGTSGVSFGTGAYNVSTPFVVDSISSIGAVPSVMGDLPTIGNGVMWDASASNGQPLTVNLKFNNAITFGTRFNSGLTRDAHAGSPVTFANSDGITWSMRFKRVP